MSHCVRRAGYLSTVQINCRRVVALQNLCECLLWEETEVPVPRFCPLVDSPTCEEPRGGSQAPVGSCVTSVLCCWVLWAHSAAVCSMLCSNPACSGWCCHPRAGSLQMETSPLALTGCDLVTGKEAARFSGPLHMNFQCAGKCKTLCQTCAKMCFPWEVYGDYLDKVCSELWCPPFKRRDIAVKELCSC